MSCSMSACKRALRVPYHMTHWFHLLSLHQTVCTSFTVTVTEVLGNYKLEKHYGFYWRKYFGYGLRFKICKYGILNIEGVAYYERMHAFLMKSLKINWILFVDIIVLLLPFLYIWEDRTSVLTEVLLYPFRQTFFVSTGGLTDVQLVINL